MIKTKNGNRQMEFGEFLSELHKVSEKIDVEIASEVYRKMADGYIIFKLEELTEESMPNAYRMAKKYLVPKAVPIYKFIYVHLSYDCGPFDFCPQDMPYEILYINLESGNVITKTEVMEIIKKRKENQ